jgi:hypothetical protein
MSECRNTQDAAKVYERFLQHVESGEYHNYLAIDGNRVETTERVRDAWLDVCHTIDARCGLPDAAPATEGEATPKAPPLEQFYDEATGQPLFRQNRKSTQSPAPAGEEIEAALSNERAYNEGWQEHIGDLLAAIRPFADLVSTTDGRIPVERLSFYNWHTLTKAYKAAKWALNGVNCKAPLGCDCPNCQEKYGPIHPGNVGKDLRSNPTGEYTNPRKA